MSARVFRGFAKQLFRDQTRVLQRGLSLLLKTSGLALRPSISRREFCRTASAFGNRQVTFCDLEFGQSALIISIAIIIRETEREMSLWKVRLQAQRFTSIETRFFSTGRRWLETVIILRSPPSRARQTEPRILARVGSLF